MLHASFVFVETLKMSGACLDLDWAVAWILKLHINYVEFGIKLKSACSLVWFIPSTWIHLEFDPSIISLNINMSIMCNICMPSSPHYIQLYSAVELWVLFCKKPFFLHALHRRMEYIFNFKKPMKQTKDLCVLFNWILRNSKTSYFNKWMKVKNQIKVKMQKISSNNFFFNGI